MRLALVDMYVNQISIVRCFEIRCKI